MGPCMKSMNFNPTTKEIDLTLDASELSSAQIRQIRSLANMIHQVLTVEDESDFFEGSAELLRLCGALIKQSNYVVKNMKEHKINYSDQALEYAIETLQDHMISSKVVKYDN